MSLRMIRQSRNKQKATTVLMSPKLEIPDLQYDGNENMSEAV